MELTRFLINAGMFVISIHDIEIVTEHMPAEKMYLIQTTGMYEDL